MPYITFFDSSKEISGCAGLHIQFYWKDGGKNLYGGTWTLEWEDSNGWVKKSGLIANLPYPQDFTATQGLAKFTIPFCAKPNNPIPIRFFLTDKTGISGNKKTATINRIKAAIIPPVQLPNPITFVSPPAVAHQFEKTIYFIGDQIDIQYRLNLPITIKSLSITLELVDSKGKIANKPIAIKTVANNGQLHTIHWKIPSTLKKSFGYYFKATASKLKTSTDSSLFSIDDKGIAITHPASGSTYQVGDTVHFQWQSHGFFSKQGLDFLIGIIEGNSLIVDKNNIINKTPISVTSGNWSWKIQPGIVPEGKNVIAVLNSGDAIAIIPINIIYPKTMKKPGLVFETPAASQTIKWLVGTSEWIKWQATGLPAGTNVDFILQNTGSGPGTARVIGQASISSFRGKTMLKIPGMMASGPYKLLASNNILGALGTSSVVEVVGSDMTTSVGPTPNTKFTITKADYPYAGGPLTIHLQVDTPKSFRFGPGGHPKLGSQAITAVLSNFRYGTTSQTASSTTVSIKTDASVFPKYVFAKGISHYVVTFTPSLQKPLSPLVTTHSSPSDPFGPGNVCVTYYYPKLQIFLWNYFSGGQQTQAYWQTNLTQTSSMKNERYKQIGGDVNLCRSTAAW